MTLISDISKEAFDAAALAVTDAIHAVSLSYTNQVAYDAATGVYAETTTTLTGGRGVLDVSKPVADVFPAYVAGPNDKLILMEGITTQPQEGWTVNFNSVDYEIKQVLDIMDAGSLFYVVAI